MSDIYEMTISKERGEQMWNIWVSDGVEANRLEKKGWKVNWEVTRGPYVHCQIPLKAITIRSKATVDNMAKRSEEMKGKPFPNVPPESDFFTHESIPY